MPAGLSLLLAKSILPFPLHLNTNTSWYLRTGFLHSVHIAHYMSVEISAKAEGSPSIALYSAGMGSCIDEQRSMQPEKIYNDIAAYLGKHVRPLSQLIQSPCEHSCTRLMTCQQEGLDLVAEL